MRGLILLRGMSFRDGARGTRSYGTDFAIESQKEATYSHSKLYHHLKKKFDIDLKIHLDTASTKHDDLLKEWLSDCNSSFNFTEQRDATQLQNFNRIIKSISGTLWSYNFVLICRNDIYLKDLFIDLIDVNENTFKYPFVLWYKNRKIKFNTPKISDTVFFFPRRYFRLLDAFTIDQGDFHDIILQMKYMESNFEQSPYINTYHDADSFYDFNPLYRMVSRDECSTTETHPDLKYPEHF
jgi:hypothetical protein